MIVRGSLGIAIFMGFGTACGDAAQNPAANRMIGFFETPDEAQDSDVLFQDLCKLAPELTQFDLAAYAAKGRSISNPELDALQADMRSALTAAKKQDPNFRAKIEAARIHLNRWATESRRYFDDTLSGVIITDQQACQVAATFVMMAAISQVFGDVSEIMFSS